MQIGFHHSFLKEFFSLFLFTILVFPKILFQRFAGPNFVIAIDPRVG